MRGRGGGDGGTFRTESVMVPQQVGRRGCWQLVGEWERIIMSSALDVVHLRCL